MVKKFLERVKSEKGVTGQDLVIALFILAMFLTFLLTVYGNIRTLSYEMRMNARAADAASKIAEQLKTLEYDDDLFYEDQENISEKELRENYGISDLNPEIYQVNIKINRTKYDAYNADFDLTKEIIIQVKYDLKGNFDDADASEIKLVKNREIISIEDEIQVNDYFNPVVITVEGNELVNTLECVNNSNDSFKVVEKSNENWANYSYFDKFLCYVTTMDSNEVEEDNVQAWVPRFAITSDDKLVFLYKDTNYPVVPVYGENSDGTKFVTGYTVDRSKTFNTIYFSDGELGSWEYINDILVDYLSENELYTGI